MAKTNPGQAAEMSNAAALSAPSRAWRSQAVEGSSRSGVAVARTIASRSCGGEPGPVQRLHAGLAAQHGDRLIRPGDVALPDAGALDDPLVRGIERAGQIGVGEHAGRNRDADAGHLGDGSAGHAGACFLAFGEFSADVAVLRSASTDCTATRMAFLMALGVEARGR